MINLQNVILTELKKRRQEIQNQIEKINAYQYHFEEGQIRIRNEDGLPRYYYVEKDFTNKNTQSKRTPVKEIYIPKSEFPKAQEIAQRCYNEKAVKYLNEELLAIERLIKVYQVHNVDNLYSSYAEPRKELVKPVELPMQEFVKKWINEPYKSKPFRPDDDSTHYTNSGIRMRSKSELNIGNLLDMRGIPYRYECELPLKYQPPGFCYHPDFTLLNKRTGKIYYLEHLGKMDDPDYVYNAFLRIRDYERNNIFIGKQLLLTMETKDKPLDIRTVEKIIEECLL